MVLRENKACQVKIGYIGGGSRNWARGLMSDLAACDKMSGDVYLYDIDHEAAKDNEALGNRFNDCEGAKSVWNYHAVPTLKEALQDADFVVISIFPGTFDEMESDVHAPEKYGIYQSVGDTTGPGGIVRAMRTAPMYEEFAFGIKAYCPQAWVISYTNPMTLCIRTLYRVFPEIKAFGCCHEVFGTQWLLQDVVREMCGIEVKERQDIVVNPVSVNHFTWLTGARYKNIDLFPVYRRFVDQYAEKGYANYFDETNPDCMLNRVKMDLFRRYGYIAAAGDRHLAEFCSGTWYLKDPETVRKWDFFLTSVDYRRTEMRKIIEKWSALKDGREKVSIQKTGEEGVNQMTALLGLGDLVTNVNMPNRGQIPNLPFGAVVETNAVFRADSVTPVLAGNIPDEIYPLVSRAAAEQEQINKGIAARDLHRLLQAFSTDPLVTCSYDDAKMLFTEMVNNTKAYLGCYDLSRLFLL